ncbi:tropomyosin alpha-1 chain-like [Neocloeon triangulifer]|uniref:tropomyosin alpha-1 chain-like n=1 Tax=Neocloeon triangulifer TaxID=2078957 RepID=UPI00286EBBE3|nr:tropomyosin alpha-1 chain-like [Neocloeon triangulifer]
MLTLIDFAWKRQDNLEKKFDDSFGEPNSDCKSLLQQISVLSKQADASRKQFDEMVKIKELKEQEILALEREKTDLQCQLSTKEKEMKTQQQLISNLTSEKLQLAKELENSTYMVKIKDEKIKLNEKEIATLKQEKITAENADERYQVLQKQLSQREAEIKTQQQQVSILESEKSELEKENAKTKAIHTSCALAHSEKLRLLSNGKKYFFPERPSYQNEITWYSANETCTKKGLQLATFKDLSEAEVVASEGHKINAGQVWWVSAKNQGSKSEKDFRWRDGTKLDLHSPMWTEYAHQKHNCIFTFNWPKGKLNSHDCGFHFNFICELPNKCY